MRPSSLKAVWGLLTCLGRCSWILGGGESEASAGGARNYSDAWDGRQVVRYAARIPSTVTAAIS